MSIFSQLKKGEISFAQAAAQIVQWVEHLPGGAALASDLKQAASDTIAVAKTGLDYGLDEAIGDAEAMIERFIASATGGQSTVNLAIEQAALQTAAGVLKAVIDLSVGKALSSTALTKTG